MINQEIARLFYEMADILEMKGIAWRPQAYRKAARSLEGLSQDVAEVEKHGKLEEIPGIGENLAAKIREYIKTGKIKAHAQLRKGLPGKVEELMELEGLGPKKVGFLVKKLKVKSVKDLEKAVRQHRLRGLPGFGEKTEENLLKSIEMFKGGKERMLLGRALPLAEHVIDELEKIKEVKRVAYAGSLRRMKETIGDIDILVSSNKPEKVMEEFVKMGEVKRVLAKGPTKSSVILKADIQNDLRIVKEVEFGSAMQYFTGNKDHNIKLRQIAIRKGMKLNEYGLFNKKTGKRLAGKDEKGIYKALGMKYIEPEMRTNTGEIELAKRNMLPRPIGYNDCKGDLHVHTKASDGVDSLKDMVEAARAMGYEYVCISDHSKSSRIANGLSEAELLKQVKEIRALNRKLKGFRVLAGCETDVDKKGELDFDDSVLKKLDLVTAAVHSGFKTPRKEMTERVLHAMDNKHVRILDHPTGRLINKRAGYEIDLDSVMDKALDRKIYLEVNSQPSRLDLNDANAMRAVRKGVKLVISTDSHSTEQLAFIRYGIATARRGWAEKKDVLNTKGLKALEKELKS